MTAFSYGSGPSKAAARAIAMQHASLRTPAGVRFTIIGQRFWRKHDNSWKCRLRFTYTPKAIVPDPFQPDSPLIEPPHDTTPEE